MKKTIAALLAGLLALSALAGCAKEPANPSSQEGTSVSSGNEEQKEVELTYWQHSSAARDEMMEKIIADFTKENPNIKVKLEFIPEDDYQKKLIPALATATAPDVFQVQSGMVLQLAKAGSIQPLDESVMPASEIEKDFIPATVDGLKYDGKYYGMPTDTQTILLFWNKDLLKAEGLDPEKGPQTWEEMFDYARKLTKLDDAGNLTQSGWGHKGYFPEVTSMIEQAGGKFYDAQSNQYVFADDKTAMGVINDLAGLLREDKIFNESFTKNWAGFRQGLVAMMLGHPAMIGNLKTTAPDLNYGVDLIPATDGKRTSCVTSWGYVMSNKASATETTKLIQYLGSEAVEKQWTQTTGELPARKALLEDSDLVSDPKVKVALDSLKESFVGTLQTGSLEKIWKDDFQKIIMTDEPVDQIMKDCQSALNEEAAKDVK